MNLSEYSVLLHVPLWAAPQPTSLLVIPLFCAVLVWLLLSGSVLWSREGACVYQSLIVSLLCSAASVVEGLGQQP
jgi:hypothetical protein